MRQHASGALHRAEEKHRRRQRTDHVELCPALDELGPERCDGLLRSHALRQPVGELTAGLEMGDDRAEHDLVS